MPQCSLCGVDYPPDRPSHFAIPCVPCQAKHSCPACGQRIGLYCFLTDEQQTQYMITICHTGRNPPPPCEIMSGPGTYWLPKVHVWEPIGHLTGPEHGKHQYLTFEPRPEFDEWGEDGDEPCNSLMRWSAEIITPCGKGTPDR